MSDTSYASGFGNVLMPPGYRQYALWKPIEILASYARFTQKGVTALGGSGFIEAGTVLGRVTASKKYKQYATGNVDGSQAPKGFIRDGVDTGTGASTNPGGARDMLVNIVMSGILKNSLLIGLDAGAITALNGRVDADRDWFIF